MVKFTVEVSQLVEVEIDETKFDVAFMKEFRESFFPFYSLRAHAGHLAQLHARGISVLDGFSPEFIEGYGPQDEMGIKAHTIETTTEVLS